MLQIKGIHKTYVTGGLTQTALNDVSLNLRDNEFVAILGPSGSGKTTLLNVIGGLDRYDSGDLVINGVSTKRYTDRDWDSYRNHTVGFIFQSYNLIPHQTVLSNVELALTISGISRAERRKRAKKALEDVGLGDQLHKKPNQMSGGQMQRVAIARALVNNPDILLADEPTGALDSDTSVQVMDLLREVSKDRLVVMVTHNPELAEEYASRIVRLRDGKITDDSNPYEITEETPAEHRNMGKASMSFLTALSLSLNNLATKKARTILTAFAGSIGIIGIALILSLSTGFQRYIDKIQEDTLSTYPLTITSETADMTSMLTSFAASAAEAEDSEPGTVTEQQMISTMLANIGSNDLRTFKQHLEEHMDEIGDTLNTVQYSYSVVPQIFSADTSDGVMQVNPGSLFSDSGMSRYSGMNASLFQEMINDRELLESQFDVVDGRWPEKYDELVLVLQDPGTMSDYMCYILGLRDNEELKEMVEKVMEGEEVEELNNPMSWTYDDLTGMTFKLIRKGDTYKYNDEYEVWEDMSEDEEYMKKLVNNGITLTITGIVTPKAGVSASALTPGVAYTSALTDYIIDTSADLPIVKAQLADEDIDVFSGKRFDEETSGSDLNFEDMITVDEKMLASAFGMNISQNAIADMMQDHMDEISSNITTNTAPAQAAFTNTLSQLAAGMLNSYVAANADASGVATLNLTDATGIVSSYLASDDAAAIITPLSQTYVIPAENFNQIFRPLLTGLIVGYVTSAGSHPPVSGSDPPLPPTSAPITAAAVGPTVSAFVSSPDVAEAAAGLAGPMTEAAMQVAVLSEVGNLTTSLFGSVAGGFKVDADKIANAFKFNLDEDELSRLMSAYSLGGQERSFSSNLHSLGYADRDEPTAISVYLIDFEGKERFMSFIDDYNKDMEDSGNEDMVINYTDITGILMSSVKTIVDSVSYVLIAFVAVSLIVSSIMIGIITYISVLERTKEIGVLRAIGASKRNISQVFNAETFIIGLCSGLIGIGVTLGVIPVINAIIRALVGNPDVRAILPVNSAIILIILSMVLTVISGLIPSSKAADKDPVIALRTE